MNIFATSPCPIESAKFLDSKRVIKMILESAQLLSTALHEYQPSLAPYRKTHHNHPSAIFTRATKSNYYWVLRHFIALGKEYTRRYGKTHKSLEHLNKFYEGMQFIPDGSLLEFPNCTTYKHIDDVHAAYRMYLTSKWEFDKLKPSWDVKV